ncbi:hypothetical protein SPISAL_08410 [Spiribacter salinus M19-40]|jgi:ATP synthase protein I|uniref:ATP synthase I chain n=2 Tax=Spiribacter salinus TaxID=1335746 RepID=R4VHY7_9GAMM|nr:ATP synthase subunit I [Spiribacter salinus]MDR9413841.1 ATP synthase subunit I [Spiribacter sp.]AGM41776.1 hypothetical protein SPISAL_08410 [Spiribacter salinus M19-40]MBY5268674.1 hypothetical protein [Spiribacter salinus]MDR9455168.1 ATP synthase subunit I [Spiribacter sp.]TQE98987.1 MAG: hypothetical protein FKY71_10920 [Spiribacter salinus]
MLRRVAFKVIRIQLVIGSVAVVAWLIAGGMTAGFAALVGLLISIAMTGYVALKWSLSSTAEEPRAMLGGFYRAEMMKLLLGTGLIFVGVYMFRDQAAALVTTLAFTLAAYGFVLLENID